MKLIEWLFKALLASGVVSSLGWAVIQLHTVDVHAARFDKLEATVDKDREVTIQAFKDIEADRRIYRERFLSDLAKIKAKLGIDN